MLTTQLARLQLLNFTPSTDIYDLPPDTLSVFMVCHIFSDIVKVPQRPNPHAKTPEETVPGGQEFLDNPNRADEDGAPEGMYERPDTDDEALAVFDFPQGKVLNQTMDARPKDARPKDARPKDARPKDATTSDAAQTSHPLPLLCLQHKYPAI